MSDRCGTTATEAACLKALGIPPGYVDASEASCAKLQGDGPLTSPFPVAWAPASITPEEFWNNMGFVAYSQNPAFVGLTALTDYRTQVLNDWDLEDLHQLTSASFPNLVSIDAASYLQLSDCPLLTTISMPKLGDLNGTTLYLINNAFSVDSVNQLLIDLYNAGVSDGTINISGGTSAAPTGAGATAKTALQGRGVTVTTN